MIYRTEYLKPDGRRLWLYGRSPPKIAAPSSLDPKSPAVNAHLRRHPILQEWVIYATHRQNWTFLPSPEDDPLAPTTDPRRPTELPAGDYEVAVFENRSPSLSIDCGPLPQIEGTETAAAIGSCEVVVFAQDASSEIVDALQSRPDVFGARLTGAGFGGCCVAIVAACDAAAIGSDIAAQSFPEFTPTVVVPAIGERYRPGL